MLNIHSTFSIGNITASPRYIKIGIPKVKQAPTKKTKRHNEALPPFDFSRPLQTPKNKHLFLFLLSRSFKYIFINKLPANNYLPINVCRLLNTVIQLVHRSKNHHFLHQILAKFTSVVTIKLRKRLGSVAELVDAPDLKSVERFSS